MQQLLDLPNLPPTPLPQLLIHVRLIARSRAHPQPLPQLQPPLVLRPWRAHGWLQPTADSRGSRPPSPPPLPVKQAIVHEVSRKPEALAFCFDGSGLRGLRVRSHMPPVAQPKTQKDYGKQWINWERQRAFLKVWRTDGMSRARATGLQQCLQEDPKRFPGCCIIY